MSEGEVTVEEITQEELDALLAAAVAANPDFPAIYADESQHGCLCCAKYDIPFERREAWCQYEALRFLNGGEP